jgi:hypothetical protein
LADRRDFIETFGLWVFGLRLASVVAFLELLPNSSPSDGSLPSTSIQDSLLDLKPKPYQPDA